YKRLSGLVIVVNKKDCMDLPEKVYQKIYLTPAADTLRAAKLIDAQCDSAAKLLEKLRELSDGFQYVEKIIGYQDCDVCNGLPYREAYLEDDGTEVVVADVCPACNGTNRKPIKERQVVEVPCPKEGALIDLLDQHQDYARLVVYAGF